MPCSVPTSATNDLLLTDSSCVLRCTNASGGSNTTDYTLVFRKTNKSYIAPPFSCTSSRNFKWTLHHLKTSEMPATFCQQCKHVLKHMMLTLAFRWWLLHISTLDGMLKGSGLLIHWLWGCMLYQNCIQKTNNIN